MCPPLNHPHGSVEYSSPGPSYPFGTQAVYVIFCPDGVGQEEGIIYGLVLVTALVQWGCGVELLLFVQVRKYSNNNV